MKIEYRGEDFYDENEKIFEEKRDVFFSLFSIGFEPISSNRRTQSTRRAQVSLRDDGYVRAHQICFYSVPFHSARGILPTDLYVGVCVCATSSPPHLSSSERTGNVQKKIK